MSKIEELERDLKEAYLNYENNDLSETLKYLDKMMKEVLKNDVTLNYDPFWKDISMDIFKAVVLNNFYNKIELSVNDVVNLFGNIEEIKKNIQEFCNIFKDNNSINFICNIKNFTGKPLESVNEIIVDNIGKLNQLKMNNEDNGICTIEQFPWIEYLEIDEDTFERKLKDDTPEEIRKKYNEFISKIDKESLHNGDDKIPK